MNVLLVSQCSKRALTETRRILDQFAERHGDATWQTSITMDGLNTLRKLLRQTARKNTAVVCHWIRSKDHSELMWIVGDASQFNSEGAVPTNSTERDVLRASDENDWHTGEDIKLLSQMAALLHDLGKASVAFQQRLRKPPTERNRFRHEWVSLRLFLAFVGNDDDETWLTRLANPSKEDDSTWLAEGRYQRDGLDPDVPPPFKELSPLAAAIGWLVVTHHRLPVFPERDSQTGQQAWLGKKSTAFGVQMLPNLLERVGHDWNEVRQQPDLAMTTPYWQMVEKGLPVILPKWRAQAAKLATRLLALCKLPGKGDWLHNPYVMHIARLSLMLADHHYSALSPNSPERVTGDSKGAVYANTHKDGSLKQPLDEHLLGVAKLAGSITHALPSFEKHLPRLARHRGLKKRSESERFRWQDKAADAAAALRTITSTQGAFIVNMASTGCGKTLANARILYALADPHEGMRATFALGLRTLTLQTGRSFREDLHLNDDELAIRVGGSASRELFEYYESLAEKTGSASVQELIEEDSHVLFEGQVADHPLLSKAMAEHSIRSLLSAPVLVCTIDHLMPATEAQRAGRQIAPMLRLMSSDLVLDELDDFDLADLPALTRLVHWAGLLGSRVLLSSATLPPSLVLGMFGAYQAGRLHYQRNRGQPGGQVSAFAEIPCLWTDEFGVHQAQCIDAKGFTLAHAHFVDKRVKALDAAITKDGAKRRGMLVQLKLQVAKQEQVCVEFAGQMREAIIRAHSDHHEICPHSGKHVSFGLVRMANIEPLFQVAQTLFRLGAPANHHIHLCVYHARFPLLQRSAIEHQLDTTLNRRQPQAVYDNKDIRSAIDSDPAQHHLFVVLGSPVTEVGRDHDYDWALVEPSSMRSLIQLAGRVQRHRQKPCTAPNIYIFDTNLRHFYGGNGKDNKPAAIFIRPGFEDRSAGVQGRYRLVTHRLNKLLQRTEYEVITAKPRIQPRPPPWKDKESLVDLEHARLAEQMLPVALNETRVRGEQPPGILNAACAWQCPQAMLSWVLPQQQPFREDSGREETGVFLPDNDEEDLIFHRVYEERKKGAETLYIQAESLLARLIINMDVGISSWGQHDLMILLKRQSVAQGETLEECAKKFTTVTLLTNEQGWCYHPVLGFGKKH